MKKVSVRRLLEFEPHEFLGKIKSNLTIVYEDGVEIEHPAHEVIVNRYIFHLLELFVDVPIVSRYSIHNYYVSGHYVAKTLNKAFESMIEDIVKIYVKREGSRKCLEYAYERIYKIIDMIYNDIIYNNLKYVGTLSIKDFLDIQMKPELLEAIDDVRKKRNLESVQKTYQVLDTVIRESKDLEHNPIAKGYIAGTISANQVKQLLASRGFVTEIDGSIFKYPIASSFVLGMDDMYDMAVESRSGAKALYLSNRAIALSEYFAREMQLVGMHLYKLVDGDCGNREYIEWTVREKDFNNLLGKHYFLDDGTERVIDKHSKHIIGKTIKLRNAMRCKTENKRHICSSCFGELSNNVPLHSNLGHLCITTITAIISQLILSTKHVITSASSENIILEGNAKDFLVVKNKDSYAFKASAYNRNNYKFTLHINQDEGYGIPDVIKSNDVRKLNLSRISNLKMITLGVTNNKGVKTEYPIIVKQGNRLGNLTYKFLEYIKQYGYSIDDQDRFEIDLSAWPSGEPFIVLPQIEYSYIDLANTIKEKFKHMKEDVGTPEAFLHMIYDIITHKISANIAPLEIMVAAFTVADPDNNNFDINRKSPNARPTRMENIMFNRSLGGAYAWEAMMKVMLSTRSYYGNNAIDHPLDVMLKPQEVVEHIKNYQ